MTTQKPIWLFIDFDNTMMGTESLVLPSLIKRFNDLYADKIGRELTLEEFTANFQGQAREILCKNLSEHFNHPIDYPTLFANREWSVMQYLHQTGVDMAPDLIETLSSLQKQGIRLALVSNSIVQRCLSAMRYAKNGRGEELANLFGTHYFESGQIQKPDPDVYLRALSQCEADPSRSFSIEDSATGVKAAVAAGIKVFGYLHYADHPEARKKELLDLGAAECFSDWKDFPALLEKFIA